MNTVGVVQSIGGVVAGFGLTTTVVVSDMRVFTGNHTSGSQTSSYV